MSFRGNIHLLGLLLLSSAPQVYSAIAILFSPVTNLNDLNDLSLSITNCQHMLDSRTQYNFAKNPMTWTNSQGDQFYVPKIM